MQRKQVYTDPVTKVLRERYVDCGPMTVTALRGTKVTPIAARSTDNTGRKVQGRVA